MASGGGGEGGPFRFRPALIRYPADHPFFEDGDVHRHMYLQGLLENVTKDTERPRTSEFSCQIDGCCQVFNTLESYEHHYNMLHRNVCSSCKRAFPSTHLLDVHILEWHDSLFQIMAEKQNMYQCLVESCPEKFKSSKDRKDHLITVHQYPSNFRFDKSLKAQRKEKARPSSKQSNVPMDMTVEDSEQLHVEAMEIGPDEHIMESDFQSETESTVDSPAGGKWLYKSRLVALLFSDGLEPSFGMNIHLTARKHLSLQELEYFFVTGDKNSTHYLFWARGYPCLQRQKKEKLNMTARRNFISRKVP